MNSRKSLLLVPMMDLGVPWWVARPQGGASRGREVLGGPGEAAGAAEVADQRGELVHTVIEAHLARGGCRG